MWMVSPRLLSSPGEGPAWGSGAQILTCNSTEGSVLDCTSPFPHAALQLSGCEGWCGPWAGREGVAQELAGSLCGGKGRAVWSGGLD